MAKKPKAKKPKAPWTERELELEARINALEYLLQQLYWLFVVDKATKELAGEDEIPADLALRELKAFTNRALDTLKSSTFKGLDPALADHVSALVHEHAERVLGGLIAATESKLNPNPSLRDDVSGDGF